MKGFRKFLSFIFSLIGLIVVATILVNFWVTYSSSKQIADKLEDLPFRKTGLLLGTSKYTVSGNINPFYKYRIEAALKLLEAGKIEYLIVSGDNRHASYNEPRYMMKDLLEAGIPEKKLIPDYAGFRTFDSVIRSNKIFSQDSITIISQAFHLERAIYIAGHNGIFAYGFVADFPQHQGAFQVLIREYLARVRMMLDIYVLKTEPHFLGDKVEVDAD
ncbi:MAG: YdcF family protein [Bacteroidetes bacterium]|jgi:SanA protein|nr:YdcF family protein [Bacteroidota bacterium]MBU1579426.1 YdcF family protein [Bacteroidota bacterium]MBU2466192.1 YdcF family protein [Bacteroidota bacterium]MBU2557754.1 YdcF family protein [Bacteroidota bacterium]MDA3943738.1 YdcF family protein [Bacteroidota bacterium]